MDYNVVTNLAGNLSSFSSVFKTYIRKCDSSSKRLNAVDEEFERYKNMSFKEYYLDKQIAKFIDEHAAELEAKNESQREAWINLERTHAEENLRSLSEAELEDVKTEYIALTSDSASLKRLGKMATEKETILREKEKLRKAVETVRENNADYRALIEAEIATLNNRDMAALRRRVKDAGSNEAEVEKINKQIAEVQERVEFYTQVLSLLDTFEAELADVVDRNQNVAELFNVNFEESNEVFKTIAAGLSKINEENVKSGEKVDEVVEDTKKIAVKVEKRKGKDFVFDLVPNADGTFNIVMRKAGFKNVISDLDRTELTTDFINGKIAAFAKEVASETKFTKQEILDGQVVIRFNGLVIGLNDKEKNGKFAMAELPSIIAAGLDNLELAYTEEDVVADDLTEEVVEEIVTPVVTGSGDETEEVVEEEVISETVTPVTETEEVAEEVVVDEIVAPVVVAGGETVEEPVAEETEEVVEEVVAEETVEPVTEGTETEEVVEEVEETVEPVTEGTETEEVTEEVEETVEPVTETETEEVVEEVDTDATELSEDDLSDVETVTPPTKAEKMSKVLASRKTKFGKTRDLAVLAGAGLYGAALLGAATMPLAVIAAGVATVASARGIMQDLKVFVGRKSAYRKLNKLAKSVDCTVQYDFENNKVTFVSEAEPHLPIEAHDVDGVNARYDINLNEELDRIFCNKARGVSNPKSIKELNFKDFSKVTVDNLAAAFDEFGGLMSPEAERSFAYRIFSGKKADLSEGKFDIKEKLSHLNPFKKRSEEDEEEVTIDEPVVEETAEEVVEETVTDEPVEVDESEFVFETDAFDDLDEAPVVRVDVEDELVEETGGPRL